MSTQPDARDARRWLGQAAEDLEAARHLAADDDLPPRLACFLAHLAAEKTLKAGLIQVGAPFRKTHDLVELLRRLPFRGELEIGEDDVKLLNPWAVDGRYPDDLIETDAATARQLIDLAARIVNAIEPHLSP